MWPDGVVLSAFAHRQRSDARWGALSGVLGFAVLTFGVFTTFSGLTSGEVGVLRAGLILGFLSCAVGLGLVGLAAHKRRRFRGRMRLGAVVMAAPIQDDDDLARRMGRSSTAARWLVERAGREGWLTFMAREPMFGGVPSHPQSNAIKRDHSGVVTTGHAGSRR